MKEIDDRVKRHYQLEKRLAQRILASSRENRTRVAMEAYNELFSSIPWHPQLNNSEEKEQKNLLQKQMFFEYLVDSEVDILDIGAGTAYWIRYLANKNTGRCVGIDVSEEILTLYPDDPPNLELYVMDAVELDSSVGLFDIAFSSQLIEHLHPDDVELHFASVYRLLKGNGIYAFDTPSRLNGPHDVSKYFDNVATGFHLKEWTYRELTNHLKKVGFTKIRTMILPWHLVKRFSFLRSLGTVPVRFLIPGEKLTENVNYKRVRTALGKIFRVTSIYIIAQK